MARFPDMRSIMEAARPWMDHGDDEATYDEWKPEHGIDNFVRSTFSTGGCGYLAVAVNEKTGWPIHAEMSPDGDVDHIWCVNDAGLAVDINGVHPEAFAQSKFNDPEWGPNKIAPHLNPRIGHRGEIVKLEPQQAGGSDQELMDWARDLVALFPKHFGL
jgi:hypothetical protein